MKLEKQMQVINILDEQNRWKSVKFYDLKEGKKSSQADSHTFSYLYARKQYQQMGDVMGLSLLRKMEGEGE